MAWSPPRRPSGYAAAFKTRGRGMSGIFISYRRSDSAGHTGRLADDLSEALEGPALFRDIEAIEAGEDFVDALTRAVGECAVMLVVMGPSWATVTTPDGQRRLHQPGDFVRREVEAALARNVRVIPVLVHEAQMPDAAELPESLQPLLRRNAYSISDRRWKYDIGQLIELLTKIPEVKRRASDAPVMPPPPSPQQVPAPAASRTTRMPMWGKVVLGLVVGFFALGLVGILMEPSDTGASNTSVPAAGNEVAPAVTAAPAAPVSAKATAKTSDAAEAAEATPADITAQIEGLWQTEDALYYRFVRKGNGFVALSGEKVEDPAAANLDVVVAPPTHAGARLVGDVQFDNGMLDVVLVDQFSGDTEHMQVTLSDDGASLQGQLQDAPVVLQRH